jgi:endonuclease/exonuclease/phosphatase family metal-dependent hydrolase
MKCGFDPMSETVRKAQADRLTAWMDKKLSAGNDKDLILLGDLNDFWGSDSMEKMGEKVHFVTEEAVIRGDYTNMKYLSLIDHIGVSQGAMEEYVPGSTVTPEWMDDEKFMKRISDHKPIFCSFRLQKKEKPE